jgi:hypothetical protein
MSHEATGIEKWVSDDIARRQQLGISKYNTTVLDNPLSLKEWLQHAYEECLDQAIYLKRAMYELAVEEGRLHEANKALEELAEINQQLKLYD